MRMRVLDTATWTLLYFDLIISFSYRVWIIESTDNQSSDNRGWTVYEKVLPYLLIHTCTLYVHACGSQYKHNVNTCKEALTSTGVLMIFELP